jgi:hypothetical protein
LFFLATKTELEHSSVFTDASSLKVLEFVLFMENPAGHAFTLL